MALATQEGFNKSAVLPLILDKLLAINSFFLIWIITAYIRWKVYSYGLE
ncbi:uncharacterized protein NEMAJ01_1438 [Nematocida major]|nr:uncharacterized protein NEMAJ01_1438 [Nematocida major]KAH9386542.1 hypothetical protein NEMAJ01_1438 [Nematocida major]